MSNLRYKLREFLLNELSKREYNNLDDVFLQRKIDRIVQEVFRERNILRIGHFNTQPDFTVYECDICGGEDCREYCVNESWG
jgi:hypothetical protein